MEVAHVAFNSDTAICSLIQIFCRKENASGILISFWMRKSSLYNIVQTNHEICKPNLVAYIERKKFPIKMHSYQKQF